MVIAQIALQVILGIIFLFTGFIKFLTPKENLPTKGVIGFESIAPNLIKLLAIAEIAGALILLIFSIPSFPQLPILITISGFAILMIAAIYHHYIRDEFKNMATAFVILCINLIILLLR